MIAEGPKSLCLNCGVMTNNGDVIGGEGVRFYLTFTGACGIMPITGEVGKCLKGFKRFIKRRTSKMAWAQFTAKNEEGNWRTIVLTGGERENESDYRWIANHLGCG